MNVAFHGIEFFHHPAKTGECWENNREPFRCWQSGVEMHPQERHGGRSLPSRSQERVTYNVRRQTGFAKNNTHCANRQENIAFTGVWYNR